MLLTLCVLYQVFCAVVQVRCHVMHTLVGGGGQHGGYNALDYRRIKHGDAGKSGNYPILSHLPDKFAGFLYDFHAFRFESLDLPPLPADRSDFDVHEALKDEQVRVQWLL